MPILSSVPPLRRMGEKGPEVRRFPFFRILQPGTYGEDDSHERLEDESKLHWTAYPTDQILKYTSQQIFHFFQPPLLNSDQ